MNTTHLYTRLSHARGGQSELISYVLTTLCLGPDLKASQVSLSPVLILCHRSHACHVSSQGSTPCGSEVRFLSHGESPWPPRTYCSEGGRAPPRPGWRSARPAAKAAAPASRETATVLAPAEPTWSAAVGRSCPGKRFSAFVPMAQGIHGTQTVERVNVK